MNYSVVWKPSAKDELADIWLSAANRNAVTQAAHAIDVVLRLDPETRGTINFDTVRTLALPPLAVDFEVIEADRIVWVLSAWNIG
jgi:plasmid stabilization system protein ParE